jgi:hypothetical protein
MNGKIKRKTHLYSHWYSFIDLGKKMTAEEMKHSSNWISVVRQREELDGHGWTGTIMATEQEDTINYLDDFNFLNIE